MPSALRSALALLCVVGSLFGCDTASEQSKCVLDPCACGPCIPAEPPKTIDKDPAWSPDGTQIAYTHFDRSGVGTLRQVWILDVDTGAKRYVTDGGRPIWSPDGEQLLVTRNSELWRVEMATRSSLFLTGGSCISYAWSPSGSWIAFGAGQSYTGSADSVGVWLIKPDGTQRRYLRRGGDVSWVPTREEDLVFVAAFNQDSSSDEVGLLSLDLQTATPLTEDQRRDSGPTFSPDGTRIAWASMSENGVGDPSNGIWIMRADGSDKRQLTRRDGERRTYAFAPSWSPDGSRIVYGGYSADSDTYTLWVVNADGTNDRALTRPEDYP